MKLLPRELSSPVAGHRFDSLTGEYDVIYFGTTLKACFGETLAPFRPDLVVAEAVKDDQGYMAAGDVPSDWRAKRLAVRVKPVTDLPFLDVEAPETRERLRRELAVPLSLLGARDLDVSDIRSSDRRVTRLVSQWAWGQHADGEPRFAGIRYLSRWNSKWECWAVFDRTELELLKPTLPIHATMQELLDVSTLFGIHVH
jgi:hypothetical protein